MLPVYLGSLCGPDVLKRGARSQRLTIFLHSLSFVLGFSLVFIVLGSIAGLVGFTLSSHLNIIRWVSGGLMIFFGVFLLASQKIPWLNLEKRVGLKFETAGSYGRSFNNGVILTLAWTTSVGAVLGGILYLAFKTK
jgi:cytochrome c-type biogenesis protein